MEKKLYDLSEVAAATGLTLGSVRQYVARGVLPAINIGRRRFMRACDLERICSEGLQITDRQKEAAAAKSQRV
jgi:hypothetical protein